MRINEIANLINNANICVDVGSDHAQLSIMLVDQNKAKIVYNIEKNHEPYMNSVNNTKKYKNIINIKSDGFKDFDSSLLINYCTISGLGASTIIEILNGCKNKIENIILCANNNYNLIREFAYKNKWNIYYEKTILVNNIYYEIICLSKILGKKVKRKDITFGNFKLKKNDQLYIDKLKSILEKTDIDFFKDKNKDKYKYYIKMRKMVNKYEKNRII